MQLRNNRKVDSVVIEIDGVRHKLVSGECSCDECSIKEDCTRVYLCNAFSLGTHFELENKLLEEYK